MEFFTRILTKQTINEEYKVNKLLGITILALLSSNLFSVILRVPIDFPNIQNAVSAAMDGDTIELADGIYSGSMNRGVLVENKNIFLRSESNEPANCIIDCDYLDRAFTFGSGVMGTSISGITIRNGRSLIAPVNIGGGIFVCNNSSILIEHCIIDNCSSIAIALGDHETFIYNNPLTIITNTIFRNNYRCVWTSQASAYISGCLFENNTSYVWHNGWESNPSTTLENCVIRNNNVDPSDPTALLLLTHSTHLVNCLIYNWIFRTY